MRAAVAAFLDAVGADRSSPHLLTTPERVADAWADELLFGEGADPASLFETFADPAGAADEAVIVTGIHYVSVCPHHLLPYTGVAHVAYLPADRVVGFSKIVRLVELLGARLVIQEEHARDVADALRAHLGARGAGVVLEARQMCMAVRGVRQHDARVTCTAWAGELADADSPHRRAFHDAIAAYVAAGGSGGPAASADAGAGEPR